MGEGGCGSRNLGPRRSHCPPWMPTDFHMAVSCCSGTRNGQLVFFTNYRSEKGKDLERTGRAGATFFGPTRNVKFAQGHGHQNFNRRVRCVFRITSARKSTRAWSSLQSESVASRTDLESQFQKQKEVFDGKEVGRPPHWGECVDACDLGVLARARLQDARPHCLPSAGRWRMDFHRLQP